MKRKFIKTMVAFLVLTLGLSQTIHAQDHPVSPIDEIQPLMLIDEQVTFYAEQIDFSSIRIINTAESSSDASLPVLTISSDESHILIDFSKCESGTYIILGKRDELVLEYLIEHK